MIEHLIAVHPGAASTGGKNSGLLPYGNRQAERGENILSLQSTETTHRRSRRKTSTISCIDESPKGYPGSSYEQDPRLPTQIHHRLSPTHLCLLPTFQPPLPNFFQQLQGLFRIPESRRFGTQPREAILEECLLRRRDGVAARYGDRKDEGSIDI